MVAAEAEAVAGVWVKAVVAAEAEAAACARATVEAEAEAVACARAAVEAGAETDERDQRDMKRSAVFSNIRLDSI